MQTIVLEGKQYELTFNIGFLDTLFNEYGVDITQFQTEGIGLPQMVKFTKAFICSALIETAKQEKAKLSKEEAERLASQLHPSKIGEVFQSVMNWIAAPEELNEGKEEGSKASTFHME